MPAERIVIVGAGPAGLATARAYRQHGGAGHVTLIGEEPLLPYERPPLTKDFLRGELAAAELPIEPEQWFDAHEVHLCLARTATAIDVRRGAVALDGRRTLPADAIVLATGSQPLRPPLPGIDHPSVVTMRTLPDSVDLADRTRPGESILVIGSGFIGCEIAASLAARGAKVTIIAQESQPQLERLGQDAAQHIAGWLEQLDVRLIADATVRAIHDGRTVELDDGALVRGSCVVLGAGVRPRGELADAAGLPMSDGAVLVDASMACSGDSTPVLAVGDVACAYNTAAQRHLRVEHWGDALRHGELAGCTLAGKHARWDSVPGFWSTIGTHTLKYAAWGDGYDESHMTTHGNGAFTVWYSRAGVAVGVLTHDRDEDYERGSKLIGAWESAP